MSTKTATPVEQLPRQQALACRLRKKTTGRAGNLPTAGEVEIENVSQSVVEIEVHSSPWQFLDLIVTDCRGQVVSESRYGDLFSPMETPHTLRLRPGDKHVGPVGLLANVPEAKQHAGKYSVQAVYTYQGIQAVSEILPIELTRDSPVPNDQSSPGDGNQSGGNP